MDNLTHTLYGLAMSKGGLHRTAPRATLTLVVAANLPDVDIVALLWGQINYLKYHRGITHAFSGLILGAVVLASIIYPLNRRHFDKKVGGWWKLYLLSSIGIGSHILLDYTNTYGIRPFLPFSGRWYAWDIAFIIDPWILLTLILGLGLPFLFRLINQEIGATTTESNRGALFCLILLLAYWVVKDLSHRQVLQELQQNSYSTGAAVRAGAFPSFFDPFGWYGIVETDSAYHSTELGWGMHSNAFQSLKKIYHKPEETDITQAASNGREAQVFLDFARFPFFQIEPSITGYTVTVRDLRFDFATRRRRGFLCTVELDHQLKLLSEHFQF
jgi:inner membrane protein